MQKTTRRHHGILRPILMVFLLLFLIPTSATTVNICLDKDYFEDDDVDGSDLAHFIQIYSGLPDEIQDFADVFGLDICILPDDTDGDGIFNEDELTIYHTDPDKKDTDGDGIDDGDELDYWGAGWDEDPDGDLIVNLLDPDSDNDLMKDGWEIANGIDPAVDDADSDTDGDKVSNFIEYKLATDPRDPSKVPSVLTTYKYHPNGSIKSTNSVAGDYQQ